MKKASVAVVALLCLLVLAGAALLWFQTRSKPLPAVVAEAPPPVAPAASVAASAVEPTVKYPVEAPTPAERRPGAFDVASALTDLFGRKAVLSMFELDDFARRFAATVDNLGRSHAPARLWPMHPAPGRFTVAIGEAGETTIGADNGLRYTPYVLLLETVDLRRLAAAYKQLYPSLQHAYEELGFPHRYFNDRLVQVIDQLLATPQPKGPLKVHLPTITGPVQPERPWVLYEFDDPELQSLTAGQKILLRMGPVNERRVKAKLAELRRLLTSSER